jgi:hypothetical protein
MNMPPRLPIALMNAQRASDRLWRRYVEVVEFDYPLACEMAHAAQTLQKLSHLLYGRWQARGGQSNDRGSFTMPKQDAITAALNRLDWDTIEYIQF